MLPGGLTIEIIDRIVDAIPDAGSDRRWSNRDPYQIPASLSIVLISGAGWRRPTSFFRRRSVPNTSAFEYTVIRVVPHVEREEFVNAGVNSLLPAVALPGLSHRAGRSTVACPGA